MSGKKEVHEPEEVLEMVKTIIPSDCEAVIDKKIIVIRKKKKEIH